ncbi:unnamed protein product [Timema podura]|uniref:Uncharacterized protein n=1 Tax=Timema podura TaxID=61482 RepID=A0ABN7PF08_TIMPD|nr:unnamed protein product [Timema podura]
MLPPRILHSRGGSRHSFPRFDPLTQRERRKRKVLLTQRAPHLLIPPQWQLTRLSRSLIQLTGKCLLEVLKYKWKMMHTNVLKKVVVRLSARKTYCRCI